MVDATVAGMIKPHKTNVCELIGMPLSASSMEHVTAAVGPTFHGSYTCVRMVGGSQEQGFAFAFA